MPVGVSAYVPLANVTLSSSAASVTFSSISQAYRDLVLVINGQATADSGIYLRFNGITAAQFAYVSMYGNGSSAFSEAQASDSTLHMGQFRASLGNYIANIMDYSATDKHKPILIRSDLSNSETRATAARYFYNTSAITSILVFPMGGTSLAAGTTLSLYGVSA